MTETAAGDWIRSPWTPIGVLATLTAAAIALWPSYSTGPTRDDLAPTCRRAVAERIGAGQVRWAGGELVVWQGAVHAYVDGQADVGGRHIAYRCTVSRDGKATVDWVN